MPSWDDEFERPGGAGRSADSLRRVVRYQRWLIAVVLGQLALWLGYIALGALRGGDFAGAMRLPVALTFILGAVGAVFVFLISWELRGAFAATVFGLATVVPCMGLMVILLVNGHATAELKKYGIPVGMFGASLADVEERSTPYGGDSDDEGW